MKSDTEILREKIASSGMSINALATYAGIPRSTLYSALRKAGPLSYELAFKVADVLDIPVSSICASYSELKFDCIIDMVDGSKPLPPEYQKLKSKANYQRVIIPQYLSMLADEDLESLDEFIRLYLGATNEGRKDMLRMCQLIAKSVGASKRKAKLQGISKWKSIDIRKESIEERP